ncbi:MAG: hypothetical protein KBF35_05685, partial [Saprospiraceae bacterium]|nr:hypothetical protein [Saprospiraceae bacterium]
FTLSWGSTIMGVTSSVVSEHEIFKPSIPIVKTKTKELSHLFRKIFLLLVMLLGLIKLRM